MISPGSVKVREGAAAAEAMVVVKDKQLRMFQAFAVATAYVQKSAIVYHEQQARRQYEVTEASFQRQQHESHRERMLTAFRAYDAPTTQQAQIFSQLDAIGQSSASSSLSSHNWMPVPQQQQNQMQQPQQQLLFEHQLHLAVGSGSGTFQAVISFFLLRLILLIPENE